MSPSDFLAVLQWWSVLLLLGIGFLPVTILIFDKFFDKGYLFSKIIGIIITSYAVFLFGVLHILPFSAITAYVIFAFIACVFYAFLPQKWKVFYALQHKWKVFIFEEILFACALFAWAFIHAFQPDINGLEKFMDYGFINSTLRADYFPPKDMWLTPFSINYYYFGHFATAVITKLSFLPSTVTFNIMLSTIFALCFSESFSLGVNFFTFINGEEKVQKIRRVLAGIITAALVSLAGNLHIIYAFFKQYEVDKPQPFWQLPFLPATFPNGYWYPNATRYIFHTIHEFPIYSWVVADLHGHVLDIPIVILGIAILYAFFLSHGSKDKKESEEKHSLSFLNKIIPNNLGVPINPLLLILFGFFLSVMYMTNAWDGAVYMLLALFMLFYLSWYDQSTYKDSENSNDEIVIKSKTDYKEKKGQLLSKQNKQILKSTFVSLMFVVFGFVIFNLPYSIFFKPFVSGIGVLCSPTALTNIGGIGPFLFEKDHCQHSYWWELLMLYGFFYFFVLSFTFFTLRAKKIIKSDIYIWLLIILATVLIVLPEFIYVKDIYPAHYRANTMFKLVFQAFIMLALSSSYIIMRLLHKKDPEEKSIFRFVVFPFISLILICLVMTYPYLAVRSYYNNLQEYKGLDGIAYLKKSNPSDYAAIVWLNKNVKGQPVVVEAQGDSYTEFNRVSSYTGLPTVLGWTVHEWLWRGSYDVPSNLSPKEKEKWKFYYPAPRINEVKTLYETKDVTTAKQFIKLYNIQYVYIGSKEYEKYPTLSEEKFAKLGKLVFHQGNVKIYKL